LKVFVYYIGKPRDPHANGIAAEFLKRSSRWATCEMREIMPGRFDPFEKHPAAFRIALDPSGKALSSREFMELLRRLENDGRDLVFLLGGHDGLPAHWRGRGDLSLTLSAMTFPHELARAILTEQIYRALATMRGHPYPR
jgi:23S rRNA (pseudouridine1915-N3)-methyltransferase